MTVRDSAPEDRSRPRAHRPVLCFVCDCRIDAIKQSIMSTGPNIYRLQSAAESPDKRTDRVVNTDDAVQPGFVIYSVRDQIILHFTYSVIYM